MKLLAWDTSSKSAALAVVESPDGGSSPSILAETTLDVSATHSERLLWAIHGLLERGGLTLEEIDVLGVGVGPGSFTGLRIGVTTARTLGHALDKPIVGFSSLAALALPVEEEMRPGTWVITTTDACKGELFARWVQVGGGGRGEVEVVDTPENLAESFNRQIGDAPWCVVGEGRHRYSDLCWDRLPAKTRVMREGADRVTGAAVGKLVWQSWTKDGGRRALEVLPRYLRVSDAELKLRQGRLK